MTEDEKAQTLPNPVTAALAALADGFLPANTLPIAADLIDSEAIPSPCQHLLVHQGHMTTTLQSFHRQPVELRVLQCRLQGGVYQRMILLTLHDSQNVVEFGIVRINLQFTTPDVRAAVLQQQAPLGAILERSNILRRVEPKWYLRFQKPSIVLSYLAKEDADAAYGRVAVIHCDGQPAIELLEVVPGGGAES